MKNLFWVISAALIIEACGGGNSKPPAERPAGQARGNAVDAQITNGTVSIYAWDTGAKGDLLGATTTDSTGRYTLSLQTSDRPILIELADGQYVEEATGKSVALSPTQRLRAVTHYRPGDAITAMITPWTNVAAGLAEFKISQGKNPDNAITEANVAISTIVGLDILNVYPRNITDAANDGALDDERMYGAIGAGMSMWAAWASQQNGPAGKIPVNSIGLSQIMYEDVRTDGLLDGFTIINSAQVALAAGNVPLDANTYRSGFASQMLNAIADPTINRTSIAIDNILSNAQKISMSRSQVFGNIVQPVNVDRAPPVVVSNFGDGQYVAGIVSYSAQVTDFVGVKSVIYDVDGVDAQTAADPSHPTVLITTTKYQDGAHKIGVRAKDNVGNEAYVQFNLNFSNSGVLTTFNCPTNPCVTNQTSYTMNGTWSGNGTGLPVIEVQGKAAAVNNDGSWRATVALNIGHNTVSIKTTDAVGIVKTTPVDIGVDKNSPKITWGSSRLAYFVNGTDPNPYQADFIQANTSNMPLLVYQDKISANGVALTPTDLANVQIPSIDWFAEDDCNGTTLCSSSNNLVVTLEYAKDGDWSNAAPVTVKPAIGTTKVSGFLAPITEFMAKGWDIAPLGTTYYWRISVTDQAGNTTTADFHFMANVLQTFSPTYVAGKPLAKATVANFAKNVAWTARANMYGTPQQIETYTYDNSSGSAHYLRLEDTGSVYSATQSIDTAIRENKYYTTTTTQWQGAPLDLSPCFDFNVACTVGAWQPLSSYLECHTNATVNLPAPVDSAVTDLQQENFPVVATDTGWMNYDPNGSCYHSNLTGTTFWYINYKTSENHFLYFKRRSTNIIGQVYTTYDSGIPLFQQRVTVVPKYAAGFPRTNWGTTTETYSNQRFGAATYKILNIAGGEIKPNRAGGGDWYLIQAGQTVTIQRFVTLPAITSHNDPDITKSLTLLINGTAPTYQQYVTQFCDRQLDIDIQAAPLRVHRVHTDDLSKISSMADSANYGNPADSLIGGQTTTISMVRPPAQ